MPNSTYYVAIACQRFIGSLKTNRHGNATANIDAPGATSFPFYVDLGVCLMVRPTTASLDHSLGRAGAATTEAGAETGMERETERASSDRVLKQRNRL